MPSDIERYQKLWTFEKAIDWGLFVGMKGYEKGVLLLQIKHATYPSGWVWVGQKRARGTLGICGRDWLKALYFLAENGYYKAWGWQKTKGTPARAFKLDLGVPKGRVPIPYPPKRRPYKHMACKDDKVTLQAFEAYLTSKLGKPYNHVEIESDTTSLNEKNEAVVSQPGTTKDKETEKTNKEIYRPKMRSAEEINADMEKDLESKYRNIPSERIHTVCKELRDNGNNGDKWFPKANTILEKADDKKREEILARLQVQKKELGL